MSFLSSSANCSFLQDWVYLITQIYRGLVEPLLVGDARWKNYFLWFWGSSQNSSCSDWVYYFIVFHCRWELYCATVSNQYCTKPLVQNIFYECLKHQLNSIKSSYLNLSVPNTGEILQERLVYVLNFFVLFVFSLSSFFALTMRGQKIYFDALDFSFWIHILLTALGKLIRSKIHDCSYRNSIIKNLFLLT